MKDWRKMPIDVYCLYRSDGTMTPLKVRLYDEDGERQTYQVRSYRMLDGSDKVMLPNEVTVGRSVMSYECRINVFGKDRTLRLAFSKYDSRWTLTDVA